MEDKQQHNEDNTEELRFFELAQRLLDSTDEREIKKLKDDLGSMIFGN